MRPDLQRPLLAALVLALLSLACTGGDGGGTGPAASISISVSPGSITLEQGAQGTFTVTVGRSGGFEGAVTVTVDGLPSGVAAAPASIQPGASTAGVALTAAGDAVVGAATLTVRARGSGVPAATSTLSLQVTEAPVGTFSLSLDPASLEVVQGESGTTTVRVDRAGGFQGAVRLEVTGLPSGLLAALGAATVAGDETSLVLEADAGLAADTYVLTVTGSGEGTQGASAQLQVTVTAASAGTFELTVSPPSLSVEQGASGSATVRLDRSGGFQGAVDLAVSGAPGGLTTALGSASVTGDETSLDITAGAALAPGTYGLTVTGSGDGTADRSAELEVTVTEDSGSGGATEASWTFCADVPPWFAVKDGTGGGWSRVMPTGSTFAFEVSSDQAGVAYLDQGAFGSTQLNVFLLGTAELQEIGGSFCEEEGTKTVSVTAQPLAANQIASLSLGPSSLQLFGAGGTMGAFQGVPDGPLDLFGVRSEIDVGSGAQTIDRFFLQRDVEAANGGSVTVDFGGSDGFDPVSRTATIANLGSDMASLSVAFGTRTSTTFAGFAPIGEVSTATSRTLSLVPEARQQADDFHTVFLGAIPDPQPERFRNLFHFFSGDDDQQLTLGPHLDVPTVTVATQAPYLRPRVQYQPQPEYARYWIASFERDDVRVELVVTDDYAGSGGLDVTVPDLSGVEGWNPAWALAGGGGAVEYFFSALGWNGSGSIIPDAFTDGLAILNAAVLGEIDP